MRQSGGSVSPMSNEGRNQYVVEHITQAVLQLMQKQSLADLSISHFCEEAGVGRASFYRNFERNGDGHQPPSESPAGQSGQTLAKRHAGIRQISKRGEQG